MSILFYRRPDYTEKALGYLDTSACQKYLERAKISKNKPPSELSFDNMLHNKTLPPVTLGDMMDYMMYITYDAETLQFYLWYQDYVKRFNALSDHERALSPEWHSDNTNLSPAGWPMQSLTKDSAVITSSGVIEVHSDLKPRVPSRLTECSIPLTGLEDFPLPPLSGNGTSNNEAVNSMVRGDSIETRRVSSNSIRDRSSSGLTALAANVHVMNWEGFTIQPFRAELTRIISHYIAPSSPRELNISHATRTATLHALQHTTHPSAFRSIIDLLEIQLRHVSHPNFIRWSICNGNKPRVLFVRTAGTVTTLTGFLIAILLILSKASRWWRVLAAVQWFIGISTLVAAYKGLCVILHHSHSRALKPWEDPATQYSTSTGDEIDAVAPGKEMELNSHTTSTSSMDHSDMERNTLRSLDIFGSANNSYVSRSSSDDWVAKYKRKSLLRKIFDHSVAVQDGTVRVLQDRIVQQAQAWAAIWTLVLTVLVVAAPRGNLY